MTYVDFLVLKGYQDLMFSFLESCVVDYVAYLKYDEHRAVYERTYSCSRLDSIVRNGHTAYRILRNYPLSLVTNNPRDTECLADVVRKRYILGKSTGLRRYIPHE